jgi:hypothetical protein
VQDPKFGFRLGGSGKNEGVGEEAGVGGGAGVGDAKTQHCKSEGPAQYLKEARKEGR